MATPAANWQTAVIMRPLRKASSNRLLAARLEEPLPGHGDGWYEWVADARRQRANNRIYIRLIVGASRWFVGPGDVGSFPRGRSGATKSAQDWCFAVIPRRSRARNRSSIHDRTPVVLATGTGQRGKCGTGSEFGERAVDLARQSHTETPAGPCGDGVPGCQRLWGM